MAGRKTTGDMAIVSIIIPCYNQGQFIDKAVDSVLQQTLTDIEIIIVNDGSTDRETNDKLAAYNRPKTRVITTENQGLAAARNSGIREAKGKYILPLDADDRIGPTYLEIAAKLLGSRPDLGIVYCRAWLFGADEAEWLLPEFSLKEMLLENLIFCTAVFRREDWEKVGGYDPKMVHGWEDYDFWLALLEMGREVYRIPRILFYYRVTENSMVRSSSRMQKLDTFVKIFHKHEPLFTNNIDIWIDTLFNNLESYHEARLTICQNGKDTTKTEWIRKVVTGLRRLVFSLDDVQPGSRVCFYPADDYVVLKGLKIILKIDDQDEVVVTKFKNNADLIQENIYCFGTSEPKFDIDLSEVSVLDNHRKGRKLVIELEYLSFGKDCLPQAIQMHYDSIKAIHENPAFDNIEKETTAQQHTEKLKSLLERIKLTVNRKEKNHIRIIKKSELFDENYYLKQNPEIDSQELDPFVHYIKIGWREGCDPNGLFDSAWYIKQNPDSAGMDPLLHFIETGWRDNRDPNPYFSTLYYKNQYPECIKDGVNPLAHYLHTGWREGKNPNAFFDSDGYLSQCPDVKVAGMNPLTHYINYGRKEGRRYLRFFDIDYYIEGFPSIKIDPVPHYMHFGANEGRRPNRFFDPIFYCDNYIDQDLSEIDVFLHYIHEGSEKHYKPNALFDPKFYVDTYPEFIEIYKYPLLHYQAVGVFKGYSPCREIAELNKKPIISIIIPVYNTDTLLLKKCIHSVLYQAYPHWELCLVDDGSQKAHIRQILEEYGNLDKRIKTVFLDDNKGISEASNAGSAMATGDYIGFLDHDDELTLNALYEVARAINDHDPYILYSDKDLINHESRYLDCFFKPDFNPELLLSHDYFTHLLVTKRSIFEKVRGFSKTCDGAQDYDLVLKLTEQSQKVYHIDQAIYQRRADASTSKNRIKKDYADIAGRKAVEFALLRRRIDAAVFPGQLQYYYQVERKVRGRPTVALFFVLNDCNAAMINRLDNLIGRTQYPNVELHYIFLSDINDTIRSKLNDLDLPVVIHEFDERSTMARVLNQAVSKTAADHLVFLNPNIKVVQNDWIEILLGYSQDQTTGAVGGLVHCDDRNVSEIHALLDINNTSWQYYHEFFQMCSRHLNGLQCPQNVLAISTEFCMVKKSLFESVNGFDESCFPGVMFDIDFCLRLRKSGVENVYTPHCEAVCDSESVFHVPDDIAEREIKLFQERWRKLLIKGDPYYNINKILDEKQITKDEWLKWFAGLKTPGINQNHFVGKSELVNKN